MRLLATEFEIPIERPIAYHRAVKRNKYIQRAAPPKHNQSSADTCLRFNLLAHSLNPKNIVGRMMEPTARPIINSSLYGPSISVVWLMIIQREITEGILRGEVIESL